MRSLQQMIWKYVTFPNRRNLRSAILDLSADLSKTRKNPVKIDSKIVKTKLNDMERKNYKKFKFSIEKSKL